jgi:hypothetical protein
MSKIRSSAARRAGRCAIAALLSGLLGCTPCEQGVEVGAGVPTPATGPVAGERPISAEVLYRGPQCGRDDPGVVQIRTADEWAAWWESRQPLGATGNAATPAVDFARATVFVISMGRRPTAGYAIAVADFAVRGQSGTVTLPVTWQVPPADGVTAQVITAPCVAVALDGVTFTGARLDSIPAVVLERK